MPHNDVLLFSFASTTFTSLSFFSLPCYSFFMIFPFPAIAFHAVSIIWFGFFIQCSTHTSCSIAFPQQILQLHSLLNLHIMEHLRKTKFITGVFVELCWNHPYHNNSNNDSLVIAHNCLHAGFDPKKSKGRHCLHCLC